MPGSIPRMFSGKLCIWLIRFDKPISAVLEILKSKVADPEEFVIYVYRTSGKFVIIRV